MEFIQNFMHHYTVEGGCRRETGNAKSAPVFHRHITAPSEPPLDKKELAKVFSPIKLQLTLHQ
ncbi:MAG: hypothetical protein CVV13_06580 [Gammaproteobacteria bacterium HGW-Gammaproteobacteria-3]|jgi:hypothetical protein|nr:MAG: hypothetical protein CVV13_06580 [Gammaproteobacteria bacterium HGW-Gammaproteobacteria-3]